jgi:glycosyltransferase involved in cell wall biosynthesis
MNRPRVLVLSAYYHPFIGGVETHARRLADYLRRSGTTVVVVTKRAEQPSSGVDFVDAIPVIRVGPSGPRSTLRKWLTLPSALWAMICLRRRFDVIYCPGYQGIGVAAILAGKLLYKPVVLQSGNLGVMSCTSWEPVLRRMHIAPEGRFASWLKSYLRRMYASADAQVCIAREIEAEAIEFGAAPERTHYLPIGVDTTAFHPATAEERRETRVREGWSEDEVVCLFVGRLSIEKGILDLITAWRGIRRAEALLVVVGPDMTDHEMNAGDEVRRRIANEDLAQGVRLLGPREDVAVLLRGADIFVQPSHYEAFGISVLEAMASGLPVVATAVGGMQDYLRHEVNALLCKPGAPDELRTQMRALIASPELRRRLALEARRTVQREFAETTLYPRYLDLLGRVCENPD